MPIQRVNLRDFNKRLVLNPPIDQTPPTALRRARGIHRTKTGSLKTRPGSLLALNGINATALTKFDDAFYSLAGTTLYKDTTSLITNISPIYNIPVRLNVIDCPGIDLYNYGSTGWNDVGADYVGQSYLPYLDHQCFNNFPTGLSGDIFAYYAQTSTLIGSKDVYCIYVVLGITGTALSHAVGNYIEFRVVRSDNKYIRIRLDSSAIYKETSFNTFASACSLSNVDQLNEYAFFWDAVNNTLTAFVNRVMVINNQAIYNTGTTPVFTINVFRYEYALSDHTGSYSGDRNVYIEQIGLANSGVASDNKASFVKMACSPGTEDYLFLSGTSANVKVAKDGTYSNWGINDEPEESSFVAIIDSDCSSLTGWTDDDAASGASTQVTFDSKSCFKLDVPSGAGNIAQRYYAFTPASTVKDPDYVMVELDIYNDNIGASDGEFIAQLYLNKYSMSVKVTSGGVYVYSAGSYVNVGSFWGEDVWVTLGLFWNVVDNIITVKRNGETLGGSTGDSTVPTNANRFYVSIQEHASEEAITYLDNIFVGYSAFQAIPQPYEYTTIEALSDHTQWTTGGDAASKADSTTIKLEGTGSVTFALAAGKTGYIYKNTTIDLTKLTSPTVDLVSADEDLIHLQFRADSIDNVAWVQIDFSLGDTNFNNKYTYTCEQHVDQGKAKRSGAGSAERVAQREMEKQAIEEARADRKEKNQAFRAAKKAARTPAERRAINRQSDEYRPETRAEILERLQEAALGQSDASWQLLLIPKASFIKQCVITNTDLLGWKDVQAIKLTVKATSTADINVWFDDFKLIGGSGVQGTYKYAVTFKNSVTGSRSNPVFSRAVVEDVTRQEILLQGIPQSTDTQVDTIEIWRTMGNGVVLFKCNEIDHGTTNYSDRVADAWFMDSRDDVEYLESETLTYDRLPPEMSFYGATGPHNASCFWLSFDWGEAGRVYYSPVGYPEGVEGYIDITGDDDPLQWLVIYNGALFAFSRANVYQILGTNPYIARQVFGVPGTSQPKTVIATPYGIAYQSDDGVRLFNGTMSRLVGFDKIGRLFQGESIENLTAFEGVTAAYRYGEYIISDGTQTLALDLEDGTWRDLGVGLGAMYYDATDQALYATLSGSVVEFEKEGQVEDNGTDLSLAIDTASLRAPDEACMFVDALEFDVNTGNEVWAASALINGTAVSLGNVQKNGRSGVYYAVERMAHYVGARLTGTIDAAGELFGIGLDVMPVLMVCRVFGRDGSVKRVEFDGRMAYDRSYIEWRIDEWAALHPTKMYLHFSHLFVEYKAHASYSITPSLYFHDETLSLAATVAATRTYGDWPVDKLGRLQKVRLTADWTQAIYVRQVELDVRIME